MVPTDDISAMSYETKVRVNAATLPEQNGRQVILLGKVKEVDSLQKNIQVTASDDQVVMVKLEEPFQRNLEGIIEVHGKANGRQILANKIITFTQEVQQNFDLAAYNEANKLIHCLQSNPWKTD